MSEKLRRQHLHIAMLHALSMSMRMVDSRWDSNQQQNGRPCIVCKTLHTHNNAFCSAECCKKYKVAKTEVKYTVTGRVPNHPWFDEDKTYVTEVWEYASFDMEDAVVREATSKGWQIYLVGDNRPSIVVFKKVTS